MRRELASSFATAAAASSSAAGALRGWWDDVNESPQWQDAAFFSLAAAYALVSAVALIQLVRIQRRVPEFGWTTQKVFHLKNFLVNGVRALVFGFHVHVFLLLAKVYKLVLLDLPGLLFFSTYTLLVLFWAEIYHQARSLPTDKLRPAYIAVNTIIYVVQVGTVTAICVTCFLIRCVVVALSAFDADVSLEVLDHPVLDFFYYLLAEILPSALVLFVLRKLPPKQVSAQYHPIN